METKTVRYKVLDPPGQGARPTPRRGLPPPTCAPCWMRR